MPAILLRCVASEEKKGNKKEAFGNCVGRLGPKGLGYIKYDKKKGDWVLTKKGEAYEKRRASKKEAFRDVEERILLRLVEACATPGMRKRSKGKGRGLARGDGKGPMGVPFYKKSELKFHSFDLIDRENFEEGNFTEMEFSDGMFIRFGKLKGEDRAEIQSVRFDKKRHTIEKAKGFMAEWFPKKATRRARRKGKKMEAKELMGNILHETLADLLSERIVIANSYETLRADIQKVLRDSKNYGKYPYVIATFPGKVVFSGEPGAWDDDSAPSTTKYFTADWARNKDGKISLSGVKEVERQVSYKEV